RGIDDALSKPAFVVLGDLPPHELDRPGRDAVSLGEDEIAVERAQALVEVRGVREVLQPLRAAERFVRSLGHRPEVFVHLVIRYVAELGHGPLLSPTTMANVRTATIDQKIRRAVARRTADGQDRCGYR